DLARGAQLADLGRRFDLAHPPGQAVDVDELDPGQLLAESRIGADGERIAAQIDADTRLSETTLLHSPRNRPGRRFPIGVSDDVLDPARLARRRNIELPDHDEGTPAAGDEGGAIEAQGDFIADEIRHRLAIIEQDRVQLPAPHFVAQPVYPRIELLGGKIHGLSPIVLTRHEWRDGASVDG